MNKNKNNDSSLNVGVLARLNRHFHISMVYMIIKILNMATERKLRILCFHGYRQTGEIFRQKTGSLRKSLKKHAELHYLTAPLQIPCENSKDEDNGCGWWFSREDDYFSAKHKSDFVKGFEIM
ncbi:Esterase OVCA2 [Armadillidium nasatum]|uniref:Esterase OVCA2 n=1 Tax=Armadillidium nasatum TaxID=96803 RepID=A0A5N5SHM6_9CRUS|nr:Esterase OVCA2 [Armadillidium nasatum]